MLIPLLNHLKTTDLTPPLPEPDAQALATELNRSGKMQVYPRSITATQRSLFFLGRREGEKYLGIISADTDIGARFDGHTKPVTVESVDIAITVVPTTAVHAATLRQTLPFLVAQPLGLRKSAGCGDRLGLATPGHIRAIRNSNMAPILAQQSMRENARTGRTPQEVMDDAMWGVFQEGWREGYGADADHLKTTADIDACAAAGYTFYTIDPGEHVDDSANDASLLQLEQKVDALPWNILDSDRAGLQSRLADTPIDLGDFSLTINRGELLRAAAKYGRAVAHTVVMYRHLAGVMGHHGMMGERSFELEMSVDETETITTLAEHVYIVNELKRLNVKWVSLAPRYVGTFEKGVDYIGDLAEFEQSFARHVAVAKAFGPYKLSLHSGSDKFSIYPIAAKVAGDLVHLKTAGTSYLEALRAIAQLNPALFRDIVDFAAERYPVDRTSYHVSAKTERMPKMSVLPDNQLPILLDNFHAREALHVTFGSVINHDQFREPFFAALRENEEVYAEILAAHFDKHFAPFG